MEAGTKLMSYEERPKHLDFFSGIGGFTIAAEKAGFETIGFAEIDPYACAVLRKHWPHIHNFGDLRTIRPGKCDLITGGFPCQPFSIAGKRRGISDDRNLWPAMLRAIKIWRPALILGENVINIENMVLDECLDGLENEGYKTQSFDIPACACGLQTMERHVWIIATHREIILQRRCKKRFSEKSAIQQCEQWQTNATSAHKINRSNLPASRFLRSSKGFPNRVDRCSCIGNSIPHQVAEVILKEMIKLL